MNQGTNYMPMASQNFTPRPPPHQLLFDSQRHYSMDGGILFSPPPSALYRSAPMFSFPALQRLSSPYSPSPQSLNQPLGTEFLESKAQNIEDLCAQRTYLLSILQRENTKAHDLLNKIPPLKTLPSPSSDQQTPNLTRKTRKRLSWLRHRLNETNNQEAAILVRLNQLTTEIQQLEYRERVEMERGHYEQLHENAMKAMEALPLDMTPTVRGPGAFSELRVTTPMLDPKSPCFEPKGFGYPFPIVPSSTPPTATKNETAEVDEGFTFGKGTMWKDSDDEASPTTRTPHVVEEKEEHKKVRPGLEHRSSSLDSANCNKLLATPRNEQMIFKRQNSLPIILGLSEIWKLTSEDKKEQDDKENVDVG